MRAIRVRAPTLSVSRGLYRASPRSVNGRLYGLLFVDDGAFDPASPDQIFSYSKHFSPDYNRGSGQEWSYKAFTMSRFDYPDDTALHLPRNVGGKSCRVAVYPGLRAVQRASGEYVVLVEDDARAELLTYRWTP
ncbi:hypothetical protein R69919_02844 [Paraburkholderia gardini]|uniref:RES domain-containing protein n=1 Tax=Paraburkholderia gardini TaxID=2823469 RepID=A0ABM8U6V3_9BURK|nr:hypothetical protein R69919_02844 [Paraburkholderia gardini]CAG4909952.1 hypothetical protein R54767_03651 [Paraburkholderia gardini]